LCPWGAGEARDLWSLMIFRPPAAKRFLTWFWTRESMSQMGSTTTRKATWSPNRCPASRPDTPFSSNPKNDQFNLNHLE
jgi:hypothetical protein